jgi:hypothetical protein
MFSGWCLLIDHASGYIHIKFQAHLNTQEKTLQANSKLQANNVL